MLTKSTLAMQPRNRCQPQSFTLTPIRTKFKIPSSADDGNISQRSQTVSPLDETTGGEKQKTCSHELSGESHDGGSEPRTPSGFISVGNDDSLASLRTMSGSAYSGSDDSGVTPTPTPREESPRTSSANSARTSSDESESDDDSSEEVPETAEAPVDLEERQRTRARRLDAAMKIQQFVADIKRRCNTEIEVVAKVLAELTRTSKYKVLDQKRILESTHNLLDALYDSPHEYKLSEDTLSIKDVFEKLWHAWDDDDETCKFSKLYQIHKAASNGELVNLMKLARDHKPFIFYPTPSIFCHYRLEDKKMAGSEKDRVHIQKVITIKDSSERCAKVFNKAKWPTFEPIIHEIKMMYTLCRQTDRVVNVFEVFEDEHQIFVIMELAHKSVFDWMEENQGIAVSEKKAMILEMMKCVNDLHTQNIGHFDLKPENFVIVENGSTRMVKLIDFGTTHKIASGRGSEPCYRTNIAGGTTKYNAPERVDTTMKTLKERDSKVEYSLPADVWSLGVILFELMFNTNPFELQAIRWLKSHIKSRIKSGATHKSALEKIAWNTCSRKDIEQLCGLAASRAKEINLKSLLPQISVEYKELKSMLLEIADGKIPKTLPSITDEETKLLRTLLLTALAEREIDLESLLSPELIETCVEDGFREATIPEKDDDGLVEILKSMLAKNPNERPELSKVLEHKYFTDYTEDDEAKAPSDTDN